MLRLAVLRGREKFRWSRGAEIPFIDASELMEGERGGWTGMNGERGEWGADMPLLADSLRGYEKEEPVIELV
jgi:hypothetical protein